MLSIGIDQIKEEGVNRGEQVLALDSSLDIKLSPWSVRVERIPEIQDRDQAKMNRTQEYKFSRSSRSEQQIGVKGIK